MSWIKIRSNLMTHPKVGRMAVRLGVIRLTVIGALHAVWSTFDEHTADGWLEGYTPDLLDADIGLPGIAAALESIGWLEIDSAGLRMPRFDTHNGSSAKRRAQDADRKRIVRLNESDEHPPRVRGRAAQMSASDADTMRTREEKRREEKNSGRGATTTVVAREAEDETPEYQNPPGTDGRGGQPVEPTPAGRVCRAMRCAGLAGVNPRDPRLLALIEQGATDAEFAGIAAEAVDKGKGWGWVLAVLQARRSDAAQIALAPRSDAPPWHATRSGVIARALELGIDAYREMTPDGFHNPWRPYELRVIEADRVASECAA